MNKETVTKFLKSVVPLIITIIPLLAAWGMAAKSNKPFDKPGYLAKVWLGGIFMSIGLLTLLYYYKKIGLWGNFIGYKSLNASIVSGISIFVNGFILMLWAGSELN